MNESLEMKLGNLVDVTRLNVKNIVETAKKDINGIDKEWLKKLNTITKSGKTVSEVYKMALKEKEDLETEKKKFLSLPSGAKKVESLKKINEKLAKVTSVIDAYDLTKLSKDKEKEEIRFVRAKEEIASAVKDNLEKSKEVVKKQIEELKKEANEKSKQLEKIFSQEKTEEAKEIIDSLNELNSKIEELKIFVLTINKLLKHNAGITGIAVENEVLKEVIGSDSSYNILSMYYSILEAYNINMKKIDKNIEETVEEVKTIPEEVEIEETIEDEEDYELAVEALNKAEKTLSKEDLKEAIRLIEKIKGLFERRDLKSRAVEINKKIANNMDIDDFLEFAKEKLDNGSELSDEELNKLLNSYQTQTDRSVYKEKVTDVINENNTIVEKNRQHKIIVNNGIEKFGALTLVTETLGKVIDKIRDTHVFKNKYLNKVMHAKEIGNADEETKYTRLLCDQSIVSSPKLFVNKSKISKLNYKLQTAGLNDKDSKQLKRVRLSASDSLYNGLSKKSYSTREEALVLLKQYLDMMALNQGLTINKNIVYSFIDGMKEHGFISESEARVYKEEVDSIILYQYASDCVYVVDEESMERAVKYYDSEVYKDLDLPYIKRK